MGSGGRGGGVEEEKEDVSVNNYRYYYTKEVIGQDGQLQDNLWMLGCSKFLPTDFKAMTIFIEQKNKTLDIRNTTDCPQHHWTIVT